jgi:uncharacterized lipoprotein YddW (UPF0748 family)
MKNKVFNWQYYLILSLMLFIPSGLLSQYHPKYEMRAIWVATVSNIDWPSSSKLSVEAQKREMIELLDLAKSYKLNTIVFQVRPSADAFYPSSIEPWSQWLNGEQGKAPEPFYDPLEFTISECRKRGIDIHVWLNPYRAVTDTANFVSEKHISKLHPEWFLTYGRTVYFDPGLPQTRDYVSNVVADIVRRYDIDAIHMDDYFYPYRIAKVEFPDDSSFARYGAAYPAAKRDDWRRENVNMIIKQLSDTIKAVKPWVEFGISPFGVWRNIAKDSLGSATKAGVTNYDDLFADILLWQKNGWIDYITPQIYWHIGFDLADYSVLADWWSLNSYGCRLYIGQAPYRIAKNAAAREWRSSKEILRQLKLNRSFPEISGSMYFSAKVLRNNPLRLREKMTRDIYRYQALTPVNTRLQSVIPESPDMATMSVSGGNINLSWKKAESSKSYVIYRFRNNRPADQSDPVNIITVTSDSSAVFPLKRNSDIVNYTYYITSRSKSNTESEPVRFLRVK